MPITRMKDNSIKPVDYLSFAKDDLIKGNTRALVNALSNIKRAIDSQLDIILELYGILKLSTKEKWVFPRKIEVIHKLGIVSPNILNRINRKRVALEHFHKKPEKEQVTEFLDIAELFIELFKHRSYRCELVIDYDEDFAFLMDTEKSIIYVYDGTKRFLDMGGIHMFKETVKRYQIKPLQTIPISNLDEWTHACMRYIGRP